MFSVVPPWKFLVRSAGNRSDTVIVTVMMFCICCWLFFCSFYFVGGCFDVCSLDGVAEFERFRTDSIDAGERKGGRKLRG